jgi:hypothetical protein
MNVPLIAWHPDGAAADVQFPYDADVVAELKRLVPSPLRSYDPDSKTWTIPARYVSAVWYILYQVFDEVDMQGSRTGTADRGRPSRDDPWVILHLRPTAPPELVTAAHRCLAKLNHPDTGGNTATMQMINHAVEQIREAS